jgi:hypothetical protein
MPDIKNIDNLPSSLNLINLSETALLKRAVVKPEGVIVIKARNW